MDTITNEKKYKTVEERISAFDKFCKQPNCDGCPVAHACGHSRAYASIAWLALEETVEKPEPCFYCGGECNVIGEVNHRVKCTSCNYESIMDSNKDKVVAEHNRVARAVAKSMEGATK